MKKRSTKKKVLVVALLVAMLAIVAGGTNAYFSKDARARNVITMGSIAIELHEDRIDPESGETVPYETETPVEVLPGAEVSKIVTVENTGTAPAWIRIQVTKRIELAEGMTPGEGYMYLSKAAAAKTFNFTTPTQSSRMAAPARTSQLSPLTSHLSPLTYKDNMTMIAVVMNGDELIENAQVSVYAGTELCGLSTEAEDDGLHFLTIGGSADQPDVLMFVVSTEDGDYVTTATATFQANAHYGTLDQPYVLQLGDATGIDLAQGGANIKSIQLFDGSGRMVRSAERPSRLYTKNDLKSLPAGVYYQQVTFTTGQTVVQKIMK